MDAFFKAVLKDARVVIVEIGAGKGVPTVRNMSESLLRRWRSSKLLRINPTVRWRTINQSALLCPRLQPLPTRPSPICSQADGISAAFLFPLLCGFPQEADGPKGTISIPEDGRAALEALDKAIGGPSGIGGSPGDEEGACKA